MEFPGEELCFVWNFRDKVKKWKITGGVNPTPLLLFFFLEQPISGIAHLTASIKLNFNHLLSKKNNYKCTSCVNIKHMYCQPNGGIVQTVEEQILIQEAQYFPRLYQLHTFITFLLYSCSWELESTSFIRGY